MSLRGKNAASLRRSREATFQGKIFAVRSSPGTILLLLSYGATGGVSGGRGAPSGVEHMQHLNLVPQADGATLRQLAEAPLDLLDAIPVAVSLVAADGRLIRFNNRAADLWGMAPRASEDGQRFCGSYQAFSSNGEVLPLCEMPVAEVLRTGEPVRNRELEIERPDGTRATVLINIEPLRDKDEKLIGAISCFQDITERALAERALLRSQQDVEDFFENGAVGLHLVSANGRILRANRAELDMLGYSAQEYIGHSIRDFHADEDVISDILRRLSSGERLDKYPARLRAKDGSIKHVLITSNVHFRDGDFLNTRCFTVDVSDWRAAEATRADTERRLAATHDAAPVGIGETDADGRFIHVNKAMSAITGYTEDELLALRFSDVSHPEDIGEDLRRYSAQIASEIDSYSIEKRYVRKDGEEIFVQVLSSVVRGEDGEFKYGVRVVQDITDRRRAQEQLAQSERRSRELLDGLPAAIYTTDAEGRITFYNQAAVEFSGRTPVIGSDSWCVTWRLYETDGTPLAHDDCPMATTLKSGMEVRGAVALAERPDGTRVPFMPFPKLLRDPAGNVIGAINMLVDLSERKRAEDEQRVLIDELNHRVKNTLATVQSIATQTLRSTPDEFMERFEARLMSLSRAHNLLTRRRWTGVGIGELMDEQLGPYVGDSDRLDLDGPEITLPPRIGLLFGMLLHELATNAVKYGGFSTEAGRVRLRWAVEENDGLPRRLRLKWVESGGPVTHPPSKRGFGTRLLERSVTKDLGGNLNLRFEATGMRCDMDFAVE